MILFQKKICHIRTLIAFLLYISTLNIISCNSVSTNTTTATKTTKSDGLFAVKKIVDGDTFWIYNGTEEGEKIRLIGVDAPESRNAFKKKIGYYGKESKTYLTNLLKSKRVKLEYDVVNTDQYGRTLAYVYLEDGTFVNTELVKNGYAMVMTVPPNVKYAEEFVHLQQEARENNRGLWNQVPE
jgi:micrococcal nuclease